MISILRLFRLRVTLMVGLSTFAGACLFDSAPSIYHIYAVLSAVCLSAGCSALNQYQEFEQDMIMERTKHRPIPMGYVKLHEAVRFATLFIALSAAFMMLTNSKTGLLFIPLTVLLYNYIYTPLKLKTPFALLIGAVTGAIPPMLGYTALGGSPFNTDIVLVSAILYIWQTPHFVILSEKYLSDYKKAGFLTLSSVYGQLKSEMFIKIWLAAFICALFLVPITSVYCHAQSSVTHNILTLISALLLLISIRKNNVAFHILNICMVLFFLLLVVDRIII